MICNLELLERYSMYAQLSYVVSVLREDIM